MRKTKWNFTQFIINICTNNVYTFGNLSLLLNLKKIRI